MSSSVEEGERPERYEHSGRFSALRLVPALVALSFLCALVATTYAVFTVRVPLAGYVTFLLTGGCGILVGRASSGALSWAHVRNPAFARAVGVGAGLFALYYAWVTWILQLHELRGQAPPFDDVFQPRVLGSFIVAVNEDGPYSIGGIRLSGTTLWIAWAIEAAIIVGLAARGATAYLARAYCETCRSWCARAESVARLPTWIGRRGLESLVAARTWDELAALGPSREVHSVRLDVDECPCGATAALSATYSVVLGNTRNEMPWFDRLLLDPGDPARIREALADALRAGLRAPAPSPEGAAPDATHAEATSLAPPSEEPPRDPVRDARIAELGKRIRERTLERRKAERRERAELVPNDDGRVYGPTRAEFIVAGLRALALLPITFVLAATLAGIAEGVTRLRIISNGSTFLSFYGTVVVALFLLDLWTKVKERTLSRVRVRVFEPGHSDVYIALGFIFVYALFVGVPLLVSLMR